MKKQVRRLGPVQACPATQLTQMYEKSYNVELSSWTGERGPNNISSTPLARTNGALAIGSLDAYINWVHQIPLLTPDEEFSLATKLQRDGDLEAARRLVFSHLRLVVSTARSYLGYGLALADLIQEGTIGLMKAVKRFDPTKKVRLVSFAIHWIRAEIHEFVLRNWRMVKVATTKAQRKLFFNLRRMTQNMVRHGQSLSEIKQIASELNVSMQEVETMQVRMGGGDVALEGSGSDEDDNSFAPINYLTDQNADLAINFESDDFSAARHELLNTALEKLDARSRDILEQRWLATAKITLEELARKYQISAERVRQLEEDALQKLKRSLQQYA